MFDRPFGFPRHCDNSSTYSATANKFLPENGFRPIEDHIVYSLRHSFKDLVWKLGSSGQNRKWLDALRLGISTGYPFASISTALA